MEAQRRQRRAPVGVEHDLGRIDLGDEELRTAGDVRAQVRLGALGDLVALLAQPGVQPLALALHARGLGRRQQRARVGLGRLAHRAAGEQALDPSHVGLDVAGEAVAVGVDPRAEQLAQARDLYVDGPVEHAVLASARQFHQLVARQRLARMLHQHLEQREFPGGQRDVLAVPAQAAGGEIE